MSDDPRDLLRNTPPGTIRDLGPPEYIGAMPIRSDLEILPAPPGDTLGAKEWAEHGNCAVYVPNGGILDGSWTMTAGGTVLIRSTKSGWYMVDLAKDRTGWYVTCDKVRVPIEWSDARGCWISTVAV